jgi:hypothetical protein
MRRILKLTNLGLARNNNRMKIRKVLKLRETLGTTMINLSETWTRMRRMRNRKYSHK